jgi:hypothetical protein
MAPHPFSDPAVKAVFESYRADLRRPLLRLRAMIFEVARAAAVSELIETLKWQQPAYLPARPRIGTTVRIDAMPDGSDRYAMFFHCQTTLLDTFRDLYPERFTFQGDRALVFHAADAVPRDALNHCISLALTYHARSRSR